MTTQYIFAILYIENIGDYAFDSCNFKEIVLPNGIRKIDDCAFFRCTKLESITISKSILSIGHNVFDQCRSLKEIKIQKGNKQKLQNLLSDNLHKFIKEI